MTLGGTWHLQGHIRLSTSLRPEFTVLFHIIHHLTHWHSIPTLLHHSYDLIYKTSCRSTRCTVGSSSCRSRAGKAGQGLGTSALPSPLCIAPVSDTLTQFYTSEYDSYHHMIPIFLSSDASSMISTQASASYHHTAAAISTSLPPLLPPPCMPLSAHLSSTHRSRCSCYSWPVSYRFTLLLIS